MEDVLHVEGEEEEDAEHREGDDQGDDDRAEVRNRSRVESIRRGMTRIAEYERSLSRALLDAIGGIDGVTVHGVTDRERLHERVPTLSFSVAGVSSAAIADRLALGEIGVRFGHMYSPRLIARLGLMPDGVVRASLVHYNTAAEIARFRDVLVEVIDELK
jgi:selenocysteine lyase/cysteine desulfurase